MGVTSVATALPRPRLRSERVVVDMNGLLLANAVQANAAIRATRALSDAGRKAERLRLWRKFAAFRPMFGLKAGMTRMLTVFDPSKGADSATNVKIGKNVLPTVSLTLQAATGCQFFEDGATVVLNTCAHAGLCQGMCVLQHGRGEFSSVRAARNWRTYCLYKDPVGFLTLLALELDIVAIKHDEFLARLNVDSDLQFEAVYELFAFEGMKAYDYTKHPSLLDSFDGWVLPNYRKIYSWSEKSILSKVADFLQRGGAVAVVGRHKKGAAPSMTKFFGFWRYVEDGDDTDDRYNTPAGFVVALYAKGKAAKRGLKTRFTAWL